MASILKKIPSYEKSFASHKKSAFWHPTKNQPVTPSDVFMTTKTKYWFKCGECGHDFDSSIGNVTQNTWCPYCANKLLCDQNNCQICFEKSFASFHRIRYWVAELNSNYNPRRIFKKSNTKDENKQIIKYWFICDTCNHTFSNSPDNLVINNTWCPYCANKVLCKDDTCNSCYDKAIISYPYMPRWHPNPERNVTTPRSTFKQSNIKCWFQCEYCEREFNIEPYVIVCENETKTKYCPYCMHNRIIPLQL